MNRCELTNHVLQTVAKVWRRRTRKFDCALAVQTGSERSWRDSLYCKCWVCTRSPPRYHPPALPGIDAKEQLHYSSAYPTLTTWCHNVSEEPADASFSQSGTFGMFTRTHAHIIHTQTHTHTHTQHTAKWWRGLKLWKIRIVTVIQKTNLSKNYNEVSYLRVIWQPNRAFYRTANRLTDGFIQSRSVVTIKPAKRKRPHSH